MKSASFSSPVRWSIGAALVLGIAGSRLLIDRVTVQSTEISSALSPDGVAYAVLLEIPRDAHGVHSAKVCLRQSTRPYGQSTCTSIAYLSGVPASDRHLGIRLVWKSPTELEIRYREAAAVYLYYPIFAWPYIGRSRTSHRYLRSLTPIHVGLVRTSVAGDEALAK